MPNSFDTSFIPQEPLLKAEGVRRPPEPVNFGLVVAFIVLFVTLLVAGGMYFYKLQVDKRIFTLRTELQNAEKLLDVDQINFYKRVNTRIDTAKVLLNSHTAFSGVLDLLEKS